MQDKITIQDLECFSYHGVLEQEQQLGQKFLISLELSVDTRSAGKKDDLNQSVNYADVCNTVFQFMRKHTFQLIEAVAERLAEEILLTYSLVNQVRVIIKKPWAPIMLSLETVAVDITRSWHTVYLGIGSNLGDKKENISRAITCFSEHPLCKVAQVSSLYTTKPYGVKEQDDFLNGTFLVKTLLSPDEVLELIGTIEKELKRVREIHWGPRTIDIDILFYDTILLCEKHLTIPHPEIWKRDFVLVPLCELNPYLLHPVFQKPICLLLDELKAKTDSELTLLEEDN
jgi:dihydroneopterin aldolase/2-amino-4-hydroxy-6-hydroxymethyldihydropteridine diphosphokinase